MYLPHRQIDNDWWIIPTPIPPKTATVKYVVPVVLPDDQVTNGDSTSIDDLIGKILGQKMLPEIIMELILSMLLTQLIFQKLSQLQSKFIFGRKKCLVFQAVMVSCRVSLQKTSFIRNCNQSRC
ncbi:MAG: hypothetical protein MZV64_35370 [Ignavibacteriales bacterium]|nr:hypothetical protein [Ignavibacteriales bacterium]